MYNLNKNKPPSKRRLILFLVLSFFHIILLLFIYYDAKFMLLLIIEFSFFLYYSKGSFNTLLKIMFISSIIFILNLFFCEGKIIIRYGVIKITEEGLDGAYKKSAILISFFFFTYNTLKNNKEIIFKNIILNSKTSLILSSTNYFFIFLEYLGKKNNIKSLFADLIRVYKKRDLKSNINNNELNHNFLKLDFFIYQLFFLILFVTIHLFF